MCASSDLRRAARRGVPVRQCAQGAGRRTRRPRRHLHAADSRGGDRHAGLRPHRRRAFGGVRRLFRQRRQGSHRGCGRQAGHHRRWRLARRPRRSSSRRAVDKALSDGCRTVQKVIVLPPHGRRLPHAAGRDLWWHDVTAGQSAELRARMGGCRASAVPALYLRIHRQAQGNPAFQRRVPAQCQADARNGCSTSRIDDVFWCTADVGWVTGHTYVAYGPLAAGATVLMYEGAPTFPDGGRFWKICQDHGVSIFYTAPTAIRALMKLGDAIPAKYDLPQAALARQRRRAHQSGSVDVVSPRDRRRALPHRRYLVADRNRRRHDDARFPASRRPSPAPAPSRCRGSLPTSSTRKAVR